MAISGASLVAYAKKFLGVPYVWGGTTPKGFDCSGLMQYVYKHFNINLPRTSQEQAKVGKGVSASQLQLGDLIISDWGGGYASHVGMYIGAGKLIEAPRTGVPVRIISLDSNYKKHVNTYRRVSGVSGGSTTVQTASWGIPGLPGSLSLSDITGMAGKLEKLITAGGGTIQVPLPGGGTIPLPLDEAKKLLGLLNKAGGDAAGDVTGGIGDALSGILNFPSEIIGFFRDATDSLETLGKFFIAFTYPSTWVRIACGWFGAFFLFVGVFFLIREGRTA